MFSWYVYMCTLLCLFWFCEIWGMSTLCVFSAPLNIFRGEVTTQYFKMLLKKESNVVSDFLVFLLVNSSCCKCSLVWHRIGRIWWSAQRGLSHSVKPLSTFPSYFSPSLPLPPPTELIVPLQFFITPTQLGQSFIITNHGEKYKAQ